jgi:hypothetical protein
VRRILPSNSLGNTLSEHSSPFSVHGGPTEKPITVTKEHEEGLERMDKLSEFAPLHVSCPGDPYGRSVCADNDLHGDRTTRRSWQSEVRPFDISVVRIWV